LNPRCEDGSRSAGLAEDVGAAFSCLGRPLPAIFAFSPPEMEELANSLISLCLKQFDSGGSIRVGADWRCEASMHFLLSLVCARLRRLGKLVGVSGQRFTLPAVPERPRVDIAILLETPSYAALGEWTGATPGRVSLLAGRLQEWRGRPDVTLTVPEKSRPADLCETARVALRETWLATDPVIRDGLLLNSLGVDVPTTYFPDRCPRWPFVQVGSVREFPSGWWSVEGQWLAWAALSELVRQADVDRLLARLEGYIDLQSRLEIGWSRRAGL
jgi:hypothetical protein